jgi:hypothetical protein
MPHDRRQNLKAAKALGIEAGADETIEKIRRPLPLLMLWTAPPPGTRTPWIRALRDNPALVQPGDCGFVVAGLA